MTEQIDIRVPKLSEISMDNLIKYLKVFAQGDDEMSMYAAFDHLVGIPKDHLMGMSYTDALRIYEATQKQMKKIGPMVRSFDMGGVTYGIIPNIEHASVAEFSDMDTYLTPAFAGEIKHEKAFKFMTVLYRPVVSGDPNKVYEIKEYQGTDGWQRMKMAPSNVYTNAVAFFLNLRAELLSHSLIYSQVQMRMMNNQQTQELETQSGKTISEILGGLESLTTLQIQTLQNGRRSLMYQFAKPSPNSPWRKERSRSGKVKESTR